MLTLFFTLLIVFQVKHFVCDYPLQGQYMLGKFKETGWVLPLLSHSLVHGLATLIIALAFGIPTLLAFGLMLLDVIIHFTMDRIKASPNMLGVYKPHQKAFWISLGVDQTVHHLTHYLIIFFIITYKIGL